VTSSPPQPKTSWPLTFAVLFAVLLAFAIPMGIVTAPFIGMMLGLDEGGRGAAAFNRIFIGDSEQQLKDQFSRSRVNAHCDLEARRTVYTHSHGFAGIAFYYVVDGRVVSKATD
jgi:hypothetical protein